jgi:hypothetical protein
MRAIAVIPLVLLTITLAAGVSGCSREKQRWRSAQAADSVESYELFLEQHPDGALATQARARIEQLIEERDWQLASRADTADAYRRFLTQHPKGKWSQEARIRLENFSLESQPLQTDVAATTREEFPVRKISSRPAAAAPPPESIPSAPASTDSPQIASFPGAQGDDGSGVAVEGTEGSHQPSSGAGESVQSEPPAAPVQANEGFGIQLGAFSSEAKAHDEWRRLAEIFRSELTSLQPHIISAVTASGQLFRLQAHVGNEQNARAICASLIEKSQGCVVVLPQH